jgi:hypothetical protein
MRETFAPRVDVAAVILAGYHSHCCARWHGLALGPLWRNGIFRELSVPALPPVSAYGGMV